MKLNGYVLSSFLVAFFVIVAVVIIAIVAFTFNGHKNHNLNSNSPSNTVKSSSTPNPYGVLTPASVPSKTIECNQAINYSSSGVPGPYQCSNGDLNVTDWKALAALEPSVLILGYSPSYSQVQSALCNDVKANISNPIEETVYSIASLYYGWHFNPSPEVIILNGTCHNVDD